MTNYNVFGGTLNLAEIELCIVANAGDKVNAVANQRLPERRVTTEYQPNSQSPTTSAAEPSHPSPTDSADHRPAELVVATSSPGTDDTCDTVSATMWFDRPEGATSFVNADDDDVDDDNSNISNDDGITACSWNSTAAISP